MTKDARRDLDLKFREFSGIRFPKLGYKVEGLPEADSVLAGLLSQSLAHRRHITMSSVPIISVALVAAVSAVCDQQRGTQEAAELEAYVEKMKELERDLRLLVDQER